MVDMPTERLLRRQDVEGLVGLKHSALYRWMKTGDFPRPVRLGGRAVRWRLSDIEDWMDRLHTTKKGE